MAEPNVIDLKNVVIKFVDGSDTPNVLTLIMDDGNLTWTETYEREYILDRGRLLDSDGITIVGTVKDGDQTPMSVSITGRFSKYFSDISTNTTETVSIPDFILRKGDGVAFVTTDGVNSCAPYAFDIVAEITSDCPAGTIVVLDEIMTFPRFRVDQLDGDFDAGQFSITGRCLAITPTSIRTDLTP